MTGDDICCDKGRLAVSIQSKFTVSLVQEIDECKDCERTGVIVLMVRQMVGC